MKNLQKIVIYSAIVTVIIILFVSISRDFAAHVLLSEYKNSLKKKKRSIERQDWLLRTSLKYSPSNAEIFYGLGRFYADEKPIGKSREEGIKYYALSQEYFQEALVRKPSDGRNRAAYAWYRGNSGNTSEAMGLFNSAIDLGPTDVYPHMLYAMWCIAQVKREINITDTAQFVEQYRNKQKEDEALRLYDDRSINGISIAALLRKGKLEWDKAFSLGTLWEMALILGTRNNQAVYESLADMNLLDLEPDKAIKYYKRTNDMFMLARCHIIKGNYNRAMNILGAIVEAGRTPFWGNLAGIKRMLMVIADYDPENYRSFYWLGRFHARIRKTEEAMGYFQTAVQLDPGHIDSLMEMAGLYRRTGKIDSAIREYEAILERAPDHKEATRLLSEAVRAQYQDADLAAKP